MLDSLLDSTTVFFVRLRGVASGGGRPRGPPRSLRRAPPSLGHDWIRHHGSVTRVSPCGRGVGTPLSRLGSGSGTRQGCRLSGSAFALSLHPFVRRIFLQPIFPMRPPQPQDPPKDRVNTAKQLRQAKKDEILSRKRMGADFDDRPVPPKVIALIGFHTQANVVSLKRQILAACGMEADKASVIPPHEPAVAALPPYALAGPGCGKPRVLLVDPPRDLLAVLDVAKCADVVVVAVGPHASLDEPAFDEHGYKLLTALKAQGLPVVIGAVHGDADSLAMASCKKIADSKKFIARYFATELGSETKLFHAGTPEEMKVLLRAIGGVTPKDLSWRSDRG